MFQLTLLNLDIIHQTISLEELYSILYTILPTMDGIPQLTQQHMLIILLRLQEAPYLLVVMGFKTKTKQELIVEDQTVVLVELLLKSSKVLKVQRQQ